MSGETRCPTQDGTVQAHGEMQTQEILASSGVTEKMESQRRCYVQMVH